MVSGLLCRWVEPQSQYVISVFISCFSSLTVVYLGHPDRDVKVPQFAMYSALQRPNPALVARYLIRFLFPEEVLVQSNVYGNAKYGILPLDHNKISALRGETHQLHTDTHSNHITQNRNK